jgi:hypothetical protein
MTSPELERLVQIGTLKREPGAQAEIDGLVHSGRRRLTDAKHRALALESRFDLAYNAAHALSLAALRWWGYRSDNRYIAFQALPHTLGLGPGVWRVLATCHQRRNAFEYEGHLEVDERLLTDLLNAAETVYEAMLGLGPVSGEASA